MGFFAEINGAGLLRNLNVQGTAAVTTGRVSCAGLLVGRIRSTGGIENCTVSGTLDVQKSAGSARIGGVAGESLVPITNCTFSGSVSVESRGDAGGIAGKASNSIINCVNEGTVYAADGTAGGIAGTINTSSQENGVLRGCINRGPVKSNEDEAGGITGSAYSCLLYTSILERLNVYHELTEPLVDFYRRRGKLVVVEGQEDVEDTTRLLLSLIHI